MIIVTGSSGFVGQHVVRMLVERFPTESIRLLDARPPSTALPEGVQFVSTPVQRHDALSAVIRDAEVVIHLAAKVQPDSKDIGEMWEVNVEGTRNAYSAAVDAGSRLFIHMSSAGVYGQPVRPESFKEDDPPRPITPYQRSKWEAESAIRSEDAKGTTLNILRPAGIYGPGSYLELPQYRKIMARRSTVEVKGGIIVHPTHVRDIVEALFALIKRPAAHGATFNIGGDRPIRLQDLHTLVAQTLMIPHRRVVLPTWLAGSLARIADPLLALKGRSNPLRVAICRGQLFSAAVDDSRFRERYPRVPIVKLEDGLSEHLAWARSQSLL